VGGYLMRLPPRSIALRSSKATRGRRHAIWKHWLYPISKTPETKYCAVNVSAIADQAWAEDYAQTTYNNMKSRLREAAEV